MNFVVFYSIRVIFLMQLFDFSPSIFCASPSSDIEINRTEKLRYMSTASPDYPNVTLHNTAYHMSILTLSAVSYDWY